MEAAGAGSHVRVAGHDVRGAVVVGEHLKQRGHVFELGRESGAHHIVRGRHALDAVALQTL